jgi:hypothetical protein
MIKTDGPWFKDEYGRTLILRGVNLAGEQVLFMKTFDPAVGINMRTRQAVHRKAHRVRLKW